MSKNLLKEEIKKKIEEDPDFVYSSKYQNSMEKLIQKYPSGCSDKIISQVLLLNNPEEVEQIYQGIVKKLREKMD